MSARPVWRLSSTKLLMEKRIRAARRVNRSSESFIFHFKPAVSGVSSAVFTQPHVCPSHFLSVALSFEPIGFAFV